MPRDEVNCIECRHCKSYLTAYASAEESDPWHAKSSDRHCRAAEGSGLGGLATFSRGFGDERYVSVMRAGSQPLRVCNDVKLC